MSSGTWEAFWMTTWEKLAIICTINKLMTMILTHEFPFSGSMLAQKRTVGRKRLSTIVLISCNEKDRKKSKRKLMMVEMLTMNWMTRSTRIDGFLLKKPNKVRSKSIYIMFHCSDGKIIFTILTKLVCFWKVFQFYI